MPRYYFDVINSQGPMRDDEGVDLLTPDAARAVATKMAFDLARDEAPDQLAIQVTINVRDESDFKVFTGKLDFFARWND